MKKILSLILAGLMTVSCAAFVAADDAAVEATNAEEAFAISFLAEQGIYHGKSAEEFVAAAADPIERWQMALFVGRISTGWVDDYMWDYNYDWEDNNANNSTFTDLEGTAAADYLGAISYANQMGIIEGYSATKFGPTDGITYRDALTMVVRTMGYKNLMYPWGYIEKAVELGLTEGVTATYTTPLNRGQVAVILYNAMFAPTKSGETLAKSIFDVDFGWETIVITATDEAGFANNGKRAADKYVGFNLIDAAGNIGSKTYYVAKTDLGLENAHDDELAIGYIYDALFTIDGDLATIVKADKHAYEVVANIGRTNNAGEDVATQPIKAYLDKYSLVKERIGKEYLTFLGQELYIYENGTYEYFVDTDKNLVGIEWGTNNIVKWDETAGEDGKGDWVVEWLYNETLEKYYRYELSKVDEVYVDWMSDAEFEEWYAEASKIRKEESQYVLKTSLAGATDTAYAKLVAFNLDADEAAEVALYKNYSLAYFSNGSETCNVNLDNVDHRNVKMPTYKFTTMDGSAKWGFVEAGHEKHDPNYSKQTAGNGFLWMNVADDVIGFENEDGSYNDGAVLYNWNELTGEIEVVKYIPAAGEGTDADSYYVTGVMNGYSTSANTITINGEKIKYGYDKLSGVSANLIVGDNSVVARSTAAKHLDTLLMQYVKALVVDGRIVDIDAVNASSDVIVVLDYAGVTSDGYIAVYGYSTKDAKLSVFKINSYNGWKKGDYRYNPDNATVDSAFVPGSIYNIKSYDAETESYGVTTQNVEDIIDNLNTVKITFEENGYRVVTENPGETNEAVGVYKVAAGDTYIIVTKSGMVYAKTGAIKSTDYNVTAKLIYKANNNKYVLYVDDPADAAEYTKNANDIGFILYDKDYGYVLDAAYDDAQELVDGYYLLGSTVSQIRAFNLLTGKSDYVYNTTNVDLKHGCVYMTVGGMVTRELAPDVHSDDFKAALDKGYVNYQTDKEGLYGWDTITLDNTFDDTYADIANYKMKKAVAEKLGFYKTSTEKVYNEIIKSMTGDVYYYNVDTGVVGYDVDLDTIALAADTAYEAFVVYNVTTKAIIVYIDADKTVVTSDKDDITGAADVEIYTWDYIDTTGMNEEAKLVMNYNVSIEYANDEAQKATLNYIDLWFTNEQDEAHNDLAAQGYALGLLNDHDASNFSKNDSFAWVAQTWDSTKVEELTTKNMEFKVYDDCNLVYGVRVYFNTEIVPGGLQGEIFVDGSNEDGTHKLSVHYDIDSWFAQAGKNGYDANGIKLTGYINGLGTTTVLNPVQMDELVTKTVVTEIEG